MILNPLVARLCLLMPVLLMPVLLNAASTVNKCRDATGHLTFTDQPCKASDVNETPTPVAPAAPESPPPRAGDKSSPEAGNTPPAPDVYKHPAPVVVSPLPKVDLSGLPKDANGNPVLIQSGEASLVVEKGKKTGSINFLARCSALVSRCYKPGERSLDACFMSAPRCASSRPWEDKAQENSECCVDECWKRYEKERHAGKSPLAAYDETLFGANSCIPETHPTGEPPALASPDK